MSLRPFRFGLLCGAVRSRTELAERLRRAEDDGYSIALFSDHFSSGLSPFAAMAASAEMSALRVGTLVLANDFWHPADTAREAATVDLLSEGRLELGLGTGWNRVDYERSGIRFDPPAQRVDRLEEAVTVIKQLWSGEEFSFQGTHYQVAMAGRPTPIQRPHPPLLVAGSGRRMLSMAGRQADIVGITSTAGRDSVGGFHSSLFEAGRLLESKVEWIRQGASDREEGFPEINVLVHEATVGRDWTSAAEKMSSESGVAVDDMVASPHLLLGDQTRAMDTLIERRERFGISYVAFVSTVDMEMVSPVVRQLATT